MNEQSGYEFQSENGVQADYEFQEKPWYTAYDFQALRDVMTPEEKEIYKEGKDMQKMRSLTITLLKQLQYRTEQNIKVRCPKCGKKACCIKVENGLFLCWSCDQGAQFKGQLHELAQLKHAEGSSIDAGYYLRANIAGKQKADADYTPMVDDDYEETYTIVGSQEANPMDGKVSDDSPFGRGLYGHVAGDKINVDAPAGEMHFEILSVENT